MAKIDTDGFVDELDEALRGAGDPERAEAQKAYLKSPIEHYGVSVPGIRKTVSATLAAREPLSRTVLLRLVRRLWSGPINEQRMAAIMLLESHLDLLQPKDLALVERMIRSSFTWAYVDNLAATVAGSLVERFPKLTSELDRWAVDESFWIRRSAMLALLGPLRRGEGDWSRFTRYADSMLDEKEFFIRKAIGWVLRETSKKNPERVQRYVTSRLDRMSGITFREAVRRLPEGVRDELTARYKAT